MTIAADRCFGRALPAGVPSHVARGISFKLDRCVVEAEIRTGILDMVAEWQADLIVLGCTPDCSTWAFSFDNIAMLLTTAICCRNEFFHSLGRQQHTFGYTAYSSEIRATTLFITLQAIFEFSDL